VWKRCVVLTNTPPRAPHVEEFFMGEPAALIDRLLAEPEETRPR